MSTTTIFDADTPGMDTFALAGEPDRNHSKLPYAVLQKDAAIYFVWWDILRLPDNLEVESATLHGFTGGDWPGTIELDVDQADASWQGDLTWNTMPGGAGTPVPVTHSPSGVGFEYAFDVTLICHNSLAGGFFNGFRVRANTATDPLRIFQREGSSAFRWWLEITWTAAGQKPSRLSPDGVVGVGSPTLQGFPKTTVAIRPQADPSRTGFGAPAWAPGAIDVTKPELDLDETTFPGSTSNQSWWWRASCYDGKNWSDYSDPLEFTYVPSPVLTLTSPSAANPVFTDSSPEVTWDVSSQSAWRVQVTATDGKGTILHDTKKVDGTDRFYRIPHGIIKSRATGAYRIWVWSWPGDAADRVAVPGAQVYERVAQIVTFIFVPGVPPCTLLVVDQPDLSPIVRIHADRDGGAPDQLNVWRNNELIMAGVNPTDVDDADLGGWTIRDHTAPPWRPAAYQVQPVVNGDSGLLGPTEIIVPAPLGLYVMDDDPDRPITLRVLGEDPESIVQGDVVDQAADSQSIGDPYVETVTTATGVLNGTVAGFICDDSALPGTGERLAGDYETMCDQLHASPAKVVRLVFGNKSIPVRIGNMKVLPYGVSTSWQRVTFTFRQAGPASRYDPLPEGDPYVTPDPDAIWVYGDTGHDGDVIHGGDFDTTVVAGTPTLHSADKIPGHTGTLGWHGGSISRPIGNASAFTDDVYFSIPIGGLTTSSSLFTVKNPGSTAGNGTPYDVRLRAGGTIDVKAQTDETFPADLSWAKGASGRAALRATWAEGAAVDPTYDGRATIDVFLFLQFAENGEDWTPADTISVSFDCDEPVILTHNNPSGEPSFELERYWNDAIFPGPWGILPDAPPLWPATSLEAGHATQTTIELAGFTGLAAGGDNIGLNRSDSSAMTSVTAYTASHHSPQGYNRWTPTGLTPHHDYWWQLTQNGTPIGPVVKGSTEVPVGTAAKWQFAVWGCKENNPASLACAADMATWSGYTRSFNLGDNSYPDDLDTGPDTHAKNFSKQSTDPARMAIAALGAIDNTISDHDTNGAHGISNQPNFNDPVTAESIVCWPLFNPVRMDDTRNPKRDRGVITYAGNIVIMQPDTRSLDKTDNRATTGIQPDDSSQTMLGNLTGQQLERFLTAIDAAAAAHRFILWLTDPAWNGLAQYSPSQDKILLSNCDKWPAYIHERNLISNRMAAAYAAAGASEVNAIIGHSDSHALQFDDGTHAWSDINGIWVFCGGPLSQNQHAEFGPDSPEDPPGSGLQPYRGYQVQVPTNAGTAGKLPTGMMYQRLTLDNLTDPTKVAVTVEGRDCTPKHSGTPKTVMGPFTKTYTL